VVVTGETAVYCIIGYPVRHSLSPAIHNAGFEAKGLNCIYVPFALHPDRFAEGITGLKALGVRGMSVTVPFKELAFSSVDEVDEYAAMTGAVSMVVFSEEKTKGYNLDVAGVRFCIEKLTVSPSGKAVVLGAGGAARAAVAALLLHGKEKIAILNRNRKRAEALRDFFLSRNPHPLIEAGTLGDKDAPGYLQEADILVNTTPVGMYPHTDALPIPESMLPDGIKVLDAIYRPRETKLLSLAKAQGSAVLDGLDWLVHQATLAFRIWTGYELDKGIVMEVLIRHLYGARDGTQTAGPSTAGDERNSTRNCLDNQEIGGP
jgi:shikimate dehydrogenase